MIDSHCHLDHEPMYNDLKNIILRSKEAGIKKILSICTTKNSFKKIVEIINLIRLFMAHMESIHTK